MQHVRWGIFAVVVWTLGLSGCVNLRSEEVVVVAPSWRYIDHSAPSGDRGQTEAQMTGTKAALARRSRPVDAAPQAAFDLDQAVRAGRRIDG